jgi:hypothetical protein
MRRIDKRGIVAGAGSAIDADAPNRFHSCDLASQVAENKARDITRGDNALYGREFLAAIGGR